MPGIDLGTRMPSLQRAISRSMQLWVWSKHIHVRWAFPLLAWACVLPPLSLALAFEGTG